MRKQSLTTKTFYRFLSFSTLVLGILIFISIFSTSNNLLSYAVTENLNSAEINLNPEFIPCPLTYKDTACVRGTNVQINFAPLFKIFNVNDNILISTTISFGNQPVCWYESLPGNRYRLTGRILSGGACQAVKNGFLCKK